MRILSAVPYVICADCAKLYARNPYAGRISTWHEGECDICLKKKYITEARDWDGIDLEKLRRNKIQILESKDEETKSN